MRASFTKQPLLLVLWYLYSNDESGKVEELPLLKEVSQHYEIATLKRIARDGPGGFQASYAASRVLSLMGHE